MSRTRYKWDNKMYNQISEYETAGTPDNRPSEGRKKNLHQPMISLDEEKSYKRTQKNTSNRNRSDRKNAIARTKVMLICDLRFRVPYAVCVYTIYSI